MQESIYLIVSKKQICNFQIEVRFFEFVSLNDYIEFIDFVWEVLLV